MESTCKFERMFLEMLKEDNIAGAGGAYGDGPSMHSIYSPSEPQSKDGYARRDGRNIFGAPKALGKKVQTRKGSTGGKKDKKDKKKEKWLKRKNLYLTGSENEEDTHPGYEDTTWSDGKITITMQDVEKKLAELRSPVISIPVQDIKELDIHTRHEPDKTPEQVASTYDRAMKADLKYPIIITKNNNKYDMILDGNHRLHQAVKKQHPTIQARVLDLSEVPEWLSVFG
jgi:hypothetical protein